MTMFLNHDGKFAKFSVDKTFVLDWTQEYCDDGFKMKVLDESEREDNGLLPVFRLKSVSSNEEFICRWDQNPEVIDIDMYKDSKIFKDFREVEKGYIGHHLQKVSIGSDPRKFLLHIETPEKIIYKGYITVNINHTIDIVATDDIHIDFKSPNQVVVTSKNKKKSD